MACLQCTPETTPNHLQTPVDPLKVSNKRSSRRSTRCNRSTCVIDRSAMSRCAMAVNAHRCFLVLLFAVVLVASLVKDHEVHAISSMYEEDVLVKDWIRPFAGALDTCAFVRSPPSSATASDDNEDEYDVLGNTPLADNTALLVSRISNAITVTNRGVHHRKWRHVLPLSEQLLSVLPASVGTSVDDGILTLSTIKATSTVVGRYFLLKNGFQDFEFHLRHSPISSGNPYNAKAIMLEPRENKNALIIHGRCGIAVVDLRDKGRPIWEAEYCSSIKDIQLYDLIQLPSTATSNAKVLAIGVNVNDNKLTGALINVDARTIISSKVFSNLKDDEAIVDTSFGLDSTKGIYKLQSGTPFSLEISESLNIGYRTRSGKYARIEVDKSLTSSKYIEISNTDLRCGDYCDLNTIATHAITANNEQLYATDSDESGDRIAVLYRSNTLLIRHISISGRRVEFTFTTFKADDFESATGPIVAVTYSGSGKGTDMGDVILRSMSGDVFYVHLDSEQFNLVFDWYSEESLTTSTDQLIVTLPLAAGHYDEENVSPFESLTGKMSDTFAIVSTKMMMAMEDVRLGLYSRALKSILSPISASHLADDVREKRLQKILGRKFEDTMLKNINRAPIDKHTNKYGTKKIAVFISKIGKIATVDTEFGYTRWSQMLTKGDSPVLLQKVLLRKGRKTNSIPTILAIGNVIGETIVYEICATSGTILSQFTVASDSILDIIPLVANDEDEHCSNLGIMTPSDDNTIAMTIYPAVNESTLLGLDIIERAKYKMTYYIGAEQGSKSISGYTFHHQDKTNGKFQLIFAKTWSIDFPNGESIAAVGLSPRSEPIALLGRVLGDRNVLYKYLNHNMISVVTVEESMIGGSFSTFTVLYLIDSASGSILFHNIYAGTGYFDSKDKLGILLHQTENMVALVQYNHGFEGSTDAHIAKHNIEVGDVDYDTLSEEELELDDYQKRLAKRLKKVKKKAKTSPSAEQSENPGIIANTKGMEIVILEVYESSIVNQQYEEEVISSFDVKTPSVVQRAYVFPELITRIGSTVTQSGITTKEFIFALASGKLVSLSRVFLNARRPIAKKLTSEDQEEMLVLYKPEIDWSMIDIMSYSLRLPGVQSIISAPTRLESTALVLASGLDMYCALRTPSKAFDVLSQDFSYGLLIATIAALCIAIVFTRRWAMQQEIAFLWR